MREHLHKSLFKAAFTAFILGLTGFVFCTFTGCSSEDYSAEREAIHSQYGVNEQITGSYDKSLSVDCTNGVYVGKEANSVVSYKGIPYAKQPTGSLRWRSPEEPDPSSNVYQAYCYEKSPIQTEWPSEPGSYYETGEDCLNLNVWSSKKVSSNKTVMVFFHGGSYGWGATSDPLYDGQNFVEAHPDIVLVTVEYRTGIFGFIDFSSVPGGENYSTSGNLGLLDMVCSLKWVQKNISQFGGNKDNVTIFGQSAGAGAVSLLPLIDESKGLFNRVIAQSGSIALTYGKDECVRLTDSLLKKTGATNMQELQNLSTEKLKEANEDLNDINNFPERDGIVLPENLYDAYSKGKVNNIDMLIGTNKDEVRYWIDEMGYLFPEQNGMLIYALGLPILYESDTECFSDEDQQKLSDFMNLQKDSRVWSITEFYNEIVFRMPALFQAQAAANSGGKSYNYFWTYPYEDESLQACHAAELPYVFNNLNVTSSHGEESDAKLAKQVQTMWVNFAKTGDPSTEQIQWPQYSSNHQNTMILGEDCHVEKDLKQAQKDIIDQLLKYHLNGCYTDMDFNVPATYYYSIAALLVLGFVVVFIVLVVRMCIEYKKR